MFGIAGFFIGLGEFQVVASVIRAGVITTFVCLAEDPLALANTKPIFYQTIKDAYPEILIAPVSKPTQEAAAIEV